MKIDKSKGSHWGYLALQILTVLLSLLLRLFIPRKKQVVILYGHKLNGNLKGLYDYVTTLSNSTIDIYFLTMDPVYFKCLKNKKNILISGKLSTIQLLAQTNCIVSDHGLHSLILLLKFTNIKFIDVWHGIPFKGFDSNDFKVQQQYNEVWLTSHFLKELYVNRFGFDTNLLHSIGYARTDCLLHKENKASELKNQLGIDDKDKKIILFAPTWEQDINKRNIFPFNTSETSFLSAIDRLADKLNVICIFRAHLNSTILNNKSYQHIIHAPYSIYPEAEETLLIADILVCDWSSIAFDFLLLDRPTIFLDIPPPFKKGFSLDETYRFGKVVNDLDSLLDSLEQYIHKPERYWKDYAVKSQQVKNVLYDNNADGYASKRYVERLKILF